MNSIKSELDIEPQHFDIHQKDYGGKTDSKKLRKFVCKTSSFSHKTRENLERREILGLG